jgi:hypothetical protein
LNINQFAGGFLVVASGTGIGQTLQIASHQAAIATTGKAVVTLADPIQVTLDATSTVSFVSNQYQNIVINPSTQTGLPVGVTIYPVPASVAPTYDGTSGALVTPGTPQYAFIVSHGIVGCLIDGDAPGVAFPLGVSDLTPGAVGTATLTTQAEIGIAVQTTTSAQVAPIYLLL